MRFPGSDTLPRKSMEKQEDHKCPELLPTQEAQARAGLRLLRERARCIIEKVCYVDEVGLPSGWPAARSFSATQQVMGQLCISTMTDAPEDGGRGQEPPADSVPQRRGQKLQCALHSGCPSLLLGHSGSDSNLHHSPLCPRARNTQSD